MKYTNKSKRHWLYMYYWQMYYNPIHLPLDPYFLVLFILGIPKESSEKELDFLDWDFLPQSPFCAMLPTIRGLLVLWHHAVTMSWQRSPCQSRDSAGWVISSEASNSTYWPAEKQGLMCIHRQKLTTSFFCGILCIIWLG